MRTTSPRHSLLILPALTPPRRDDLTLLFLTDGNTRSATGGGYAGGARRVVSIAEHLARRPDVATMVACILSPDNVAKRGERFFSALYEEFIELGVAIQSRGTLVSSGIRMDLWGDLRPLRARGGRATALADAIEAVVGMTAGVTAPDLRLVLGVGYGPDTVRELGVDIVVRTGVEEPGVLRLSGLATGDGVANCAITTLWPDVVPGEVDEVIELCKRGSSPRLAGGHGIAEIVDLASALAREELDEPARVTLHTDVAPAVVAASLERLHAGPLRGSANVLVEHVVDRHAAPTRYGAERGARHRLTVVGGSPAPWTIGPGERASVLAPGQTPPLFTIPGWLVLGHANVYACAATTQAMVAGIRAAQRFGAAHPPLFGSERAHGSGAAPRASEVVTPRPGTSERDELADRFVEKTLAWAAAAGLLLPDPGWRTAAMNYALTAFFIHFRIPAEWDPEGALWEERADLIARYMLLVAAGDEGIFDSVIERETPERRWARLQRASRYLQGIFGGEGARVPVPDVPGADLLAAISGQWVELFERYRRTCHPAAAATFRAGLSSLYAASLAEHRAGIASGTLDVERGSRVTIEERFASAPSSIASRARALTGGAVEGNPSDPNELRVLSYLDEVGSAIGAGLLFRTAALAAPASSVTGHHVALLDTATALLDYQVRLSNDMSGFLASPGGDRDPKQNACTILVPRPASGPLREAAVVAALATCRRIAGWLSGEVGAQIERVVETWPSMGAILRRGTFVGRRVYEVGHYTTVTRVQMSAIFDEWEARGCREERSERPRSIEPGRRFAWAPRATSRA